MVKSDGTHQHWIGNNRTKSSPFVVRSFHDRVFFQGTDDKLRVADVDPNGVSTQHSVGNNTTASSPFVSVVRPDRVYFRGTDNRLLAVNSNGTQLQWLGKNTTPSTPVVGIEDIVCFQGTDNKLWLINSDGANQRPLGNIRAKSSPFVALPVVIP